MDRDWLIGSNGETIATAIQFVLSCDGIGEREYSTRLGVSREFAAQIVRDWPDVDLSSEDVHSLINNSLNELCHGVRHPGGWPEVLAFSRSEAQQIFAEYRRVREL